MANRFEKGKHIFFLFKNGYTVQDSQLKPRYYLEERTAEKYLPYGEEIVEYAPVVHGEWLDNDDRCYCNRCFEFSCTVTDDTGTIYNDLTKFCPNCGAKMDGGRKES